MKKVTENISKSELRELFESSDGPKVGTSLIEFEREAYYQSNLLNKVEIPVVLFNKSYGDLFYGKLDNKNRTIVPNEEFIVNMNFVKGDQKSFNFVSKAFQGFIDEWNIITQQEQKSIEVIPTKCYNNFEKEYRDYINQFSAIVTTYFLNNNNHKLIKGLDSFIKEVSKAISVDTKVNPFTISKFISSRFCSEQVTGLVIELPHKDNFYITKKEFIQSESFEKYITTAKKYGFIADKNYPWKLHFNIHSPYGKELLQTYMETEEVTENNFYKKFFIRTVDYEFYFFKKYILEIYDYFSTVEPTSTVEKIDRINNKNTPKIIKIKRYPLIETQKSEIVNNNFEYNWWRLFIFVKLCEENVETNQTQFDELVKQSHALLQKVDISAAMDYVQDRLSMFPISQTRQRNFSY